MIDNLDDWDSVSSLSLALSFEGRDLAQDKNFEDAEKQLRRAIAFDTYCFMAYEWLEYVLDAQERFDESSEVRAAKRRSALEMIFIK